MDKQDASDASERRSARWFRKSDLSGFVDRSTLAADGWSREDLIEGPLAGILNT